MFSCLQRRTDRAHETSFARWIAVGVEKSVFVYCIRQLSHTEHCTNYKGTHLQPNTDIRQPIEYKTKRHTNTSIQTLKKRKKKKQRNEENKSSFWSRCVRTLSCIVIIVMNIVVAALFRYWYLELWRRFEFCVVCCFIVESVFRQNFKKHVYCMVFVKFCVFCAEILLNSMKKAAVLGGYRSDEVHVFK